jgi:hypothetical protein
MARPAWRLLRRQRLRRRRAARGSGDAWSEHGDDDMFFFRYQNSTVRHSRFATVFFSMNMAESRKIV